MLRAPLRSPDVGNHAPRTGSRSGQITKFAPRAQHHSMARAASATRTGAASRRAPARGSVDPRSGAGRVVRRGARDLAGVVEPEHLGARAAVTAIEDRHA